MKKLLFFLLLISCYAIHAQTGEKIAYYYQGKKLSFTVNNNRVIIRLKTGETSRQRRFQLSAVLKVPDSAITAMADVKLVAVKMSTGVNASRLRGMAAALSTQGYADFVHPCFASSNGKDMGYGDELVVKIKTSTASSTFNKLLLQNHCSIIKKYPFASNIYVLSAGPANNYDALAVANRFFETGLFDYAEPDFTLLDGLFAADPNDPLYGYQWAHQNTGSPIQYGGTPGADMKVQQAWAISTGVGIKVAVIDEGVDTGHADLKANLLQGYDCISGTANPGDGRPRGSARAHGTNCTGIIAAVANNNIGIAGVAPDSKIIPINLAAANGNFTSESNIAGGFDYAWQHGADIISNSWGGGTPSDVIDDAIKRAVTLGRGGKGTLVFFASGNNNTGIGYPASNADVICVGGVNMCGQRKSYASVGCDFEYWGASYGTGLDVVAPCVKIISTDISGSGGYNKAAGAAGDYLYTFNGTSSATPSAAGVAALILATNTSLTGIQVRSILENSCDKLAGYNYTQVAGQPNGTWNNETGHGRVNAFTAVQVALSGQYCSVQTKAGSDTRFCPGGSVNLSVINPVTGTSYQWRKDGVNFNTGNSITAVVAGSYDVVAIALNGCMATAAPIIVSVLTNTPALTAFAGIDTLICAGNAVKLGANPTASGGAPYLPVKRIFGMDWLSNSFVKFSSQDPLHYDTVGRNMVSVADFDAGNFFTGGDFTPYGYYALTQGTNKFIKVDTATGVQQLIGIAAPPAGYDWSGLAWDPSTKNLYGLASAASTSSLCIINPFTAAVTSVATIPVGLTEWIAVNNNGYMYAMSDDNYIYSINKLTGAATALPNFIGADAIYQQDADFDPVDNTLYMTALIKSENYASDLRTADTATGMTNVIGSLGGLSEIDATGIAGPGYQYNWSPAAGLSSTNVSVPVATPAVTTTYTLNVTDMCGNTASSQVTVKVSTAPPAVITAATDSICVAETTRLHTASNSGYTYQWYQNGTAITNATDSFYAAGAGGSYTVKIVNGACDSTSVPFIVKACELRLNNNAPESLCSVYFYDSGGVAGNYGNGESFTKTITASTPGNLVRLNITSFNTEAGNDVLTIYDGPNTSSPVLAALSGTPGVPLSYTSISNTITVSFTSNGTINGAGWTGTIGCYLPAVYRSRASGNADNVATWEVKSGGNFINAVDVPHMYDDSIIIQSGHTVTINNPVQLDQVWVQAGAVLQVASAFTLHNGTGSDLLVDGALVVGALGSINGNGILTLNGNLDNSASINSNILVKTDITGKALQTLAAGGSFSTVAVSNPQVKLNLSSALSIDSLIVNNGKGTITVTAVNPATILTVNRKLGLQSGRIIMNNAVLNLAIGCISDSGNTSSFVEGPVRSNTSAAGLSNLYFPIGKDTVYRPVVLAITHLSAGLSAYQAEMFNTVPANRSLPGGINAVSNKRYFKIQNMGSQPVGNAAAIIIYGADDQVTDTAGLRIAKDDGAAGWINEGGTGNGSGNGSIRSSVSFTGLGDFVLANATNGNNAFAVSWLQTAAALLGKQVQVTWTTGNEINITDYSVERSADGNSFTEIALVKATTIIAAEKQYLVMDRLPLKGINYYRIKRIDKNGQINYSRTVQVNVTETADFILWPNPASTTVTIQNRQTMLRLQCYNSNGQLILNVQPFTSQFSIPVQHWAAGIYELTITANGQVIHTRFVKK